MAAMSTTTTTTAPEIPASANLICTADRLISDLKGQMSTLYFATLGVINFTEGSCPNPGDFDGILAHCRTAWENATRLQEAWEALPPFQHSDPSTDPAAQGVCWSDPAAFLAWREWAKATMRTRAACAADRRAGGNMTDAEIDRLTEAESKAAEKIEGDGPIARAARLHVRLYDQGKPVDHDEFGPDLVGDAVLALMAALAPFLPEEMGAAFRSPFGFSIEGGAS